MENSKNDKGARVVIFSSIIGVIVLLLVVWLAFHFIFSSKNSKNELTQIVPTVTVVIPTDEPLITPTIVPSAKAGLKTFIFSNPASQYSFEYPSIWGLVEINHDNIVRLNFSGHCRVEFSTLNNNNGTTIATTEETETQIYARRKFQVTMIKRNNTPYLEIFSLSNATSKDGFSLVTVELPVSNLPQCQQSVSQILASLTFGQ